MIRIANLRVIRNFGWAEDPLDVRDAPFSASSLAAAPVASGEVDLAQFYKNVSDQLYLPACVANAGTDMMEAATIIQKVEGGMPLAQAKASTPDYSRMFGWWNCRNEMDPPQTNNPNSGTYNRLMMDVLSRHGICTEARWPYDPLKATVRPSIMAYREAFANRFDAFYSITESGDARLEAILKAFSSKHSVLFGTALDASFLNYAGGSVIPRPTGSIIGRHAMVLVGWSPSRNAFKVRNSWTSAWGESGYGWMSPSFVTWSETKSLWVATKGLR